jgi:hypothetical protein
VDAPGERKPQRKRPGKFWNDRGKSGDGSYTFPMNDWEKPETWEHIGTAATGLTLAIARLKKAFPKKQSKYATKKDLQDVIAAVQTIIDIVASLSEVTGRGIVKGLVTVHERERGMSRMSAVIAEAIQTIGTRILDQEQRIKALENRVKDRPPQLRVKRVAKTRTQIEDERK